MSIFQELETFYKQSVPNDFNKYKLNKSSYLYDFLPEDLKTYFSKYSLFYLGKFKFEIKNTMLNCHKMGRYIEIASCYYGVGMYATWNYYVDKKVYGKRIDDEFTNVTYKTFTELVTDFYNNLKKYDIKNGSISAYQSFLPLS
jgi:hypothetical protein